MLKLGWSGPWPRYESVRQENAKTSQKWPFDELAPILGRQSSRRLCGPREGHGSHAAADPNVHCVPLLSSQSMSVAVVDGSQAANRRTLSSDLWNATRKFLKVWLVLYVLVSRLY
ncbi:hypothetical protein D918_01405 [Trichuris suis]|nr:hypothetical protein D918_01405 [Trichuris suis]